MTAVQKVLVIGAGAAGLTASALLADAGVQVDLVEAKPEVSALGSGITLQANALRVLREVGILDQCLVEGADSTQLRLRAPDPQATVLATMGAEGRGPTDLPNAIGMYRPALAGLLTERALELGVRFRFATTVAQLDQDDDGVDVTLDDGSVRRYDLVVAADGVRSATRAQLGIDLETRPLGMGIWRVFAPRPADVPTGELYYGGHCYIAGYTPTSADRLYAFLVEDAQDRSQVTPEEKVAIVRELASHYSGPWDEIRESITDPDAIHYTQFEEHLLPAPWNRGRVVVIGDAAHVCPPTFAQGAALALEDALVLTELLRAATTVDDELWDQFHARRLPRVQAVVEGSVTLARWQLEHVQGDLPGLMGGVQAVIAQPA
ncbi:FAD-dependent monooxygenase [Modestobacter versicolor]|uniref:2-polyprenyl-6-methoxyphenol hydroxylase n=1 Tax=Modestobacter versicolor TaxID=429133 RepID=A0A323VBK4_9ACTN|nr:FAD-dependent monooxygenase [Modestobacter versicolor]MBB3674768.1 2-polyprenyl-6-methoxyphenol hydroxylase-like FAD-dependent oxidoreductase [Modestobacter versicolor]PZA22147.1 2-polyprenyl-6-methoxyphenol hydroxylase [Modestobacter versicolor]